MNETSAEKGFEFILWGSLGLSVINEIIIIIRSKSRSCFLVNVRTKLVKVGIIDLRYICRKYGKVGIDSS